MKHTVIQRIMTGAAVAAVLGVTALGGIKLWQGKNGGRIVTTPGYASAASLESAAENAKANLFGGRGPLQFSTTGRVMADSDNWYARPGYSAKKGDGAEIALQKTEIGLDGNTYCLTDYENGGLYSFSTETGMLCALADDGTVTAQTRFPGCDADKLTEIHRIVRLSDTKYYVDGWRIAWADSEKKHLDASWLTEFCYIIDAASENAQVLFGSEDQPVISYDRVYSDGKGGVYAMVLTGEGNAAHYALGHITEAGIEIVLDEYCRSLCWFIADNCVYYCHPLDDSDNSFFRFNLATGEKTVLQENCGFGSIVYKDGRMYTQLLEEENGTNPIRMISCKPDLSDRQEFTFTYPEDREKDLGKALFTDICGDSLIFDLPPRNAVTDIPSAENSEMLPENAEYVGGEGFMTYDLNTGAVQCFRYAGKSYGYVSAAE